MYVKHVTTNGTIPDTMQSSCKDYIMCIVSIIATVVPVFLVVAQMPYVTPCKVPELSQVFEMLTMHIS